MNVVEVGNGTRTAIDEESVARLVARILEEEGVRGAEVDVTFVGERRMRDVNREYRGKDEVTDVLSFPLEEWEPGAQAGRHGGPGGAQAGEGPLAPDPAEAAAAVVAGTAGPPLLLGDILICARRALAQAEAGDLPPSLELAVLLAHGTLHLLGYDHETDAGQMALRQAELLELVDWEGISVSPAR